MNILVSGKLLAGAALAVGLACGMSAADAQDRYGRHAYPYPSYYYGTPYWYGAIPGGKLPGVHPEDYPQTTIHVIRYTYFYRGQGRCGRYRYWNGYCCIDARWGRSRYRFYDDLFDW